MRWGSDPPMALFMDVEVRLIRVGNEADLWTEKFRFTSPERKFSVWAEDDGRRLKAGFDRAYREIAEKAIERAFVLVPLR